MDEFNSFSTEGKEMFHTITGNKKCASLSLFLQKDVKNFESRI